METFNIKTLTLGSLGTNCYILSDKETSEAVIIDPAANASEILNAITAIGAKVRYVVLTHGHFDHMGAANSILDTTGARLVCHKAESGSLLSPMINLSSSFGSHVLSLTPDILVSENEEITFGNSSLKVISTPGHTVGGMCLLAKNTVFSGDTLFSRSVGRSDFPGGNENILMNSIKNRLYTLPDNTRVYPGHGPATTIGDEKRENFYVR